MKSEVQKGGRRPRRSAAQFGKELRMELNKVAWPSRPQVIKASLIILLVTALSTIYISGLDAVLAKGYLILKG